MPELICNLRNIFVLQVLEFQAPRPMGEKGGGQTCIKTFLGHVGMCVQNFIKIGAGVAGLRGEGS